MYKAFAGHAGPVFGFNVWAIDEDEMTDECGMLCSQDEGNTCAPAMADKGYLTKSQCRHTMDNVLGDGVKVVAGVGSVAEAMSTQVEGDGEVMIAEMRSDQPPRIGGSSQTMK